jgi:hypothetical protein
VRRWLARGGLLLVGVALAGLPVAAALAGRDGLVLPFGAVGLAALCSFAAYRGAVALRRRIDEIGDGKTHRRT